ncbi:brefeldin A-inhibited guanine nucleotide-exchange protein 1 isoform X3 [Cynara cardunculus var. scolymus]|uniref:brefeldin A-inhibited guanine nucleotide-exchange protein 1 isoform X3 n=1 Tax=Cynara cardunculus var. scolymus TaxID=59895 RepID=UPI000D62714A|nr:brefeldin A-inhibited guanine nucleotide-exchange protein 1 isoform X3 [Cynara cardunculus var. scolymus]
MSSGSQTLGGQSRCGWLLGPSLDKIIKNAAWRKHSHIVTACKSALDKLETLADDPSSSTPLYGVSSLSDAESLILPLILAIDSSSSKVVEPALDCSYRLFSLRLIRCEIDPSEQPSSLIFRLIDSICKCGSLGEEVVELSILKTLLSAVRSSTVFIRADCLNQIVKTCYNIYLGGVNGTNQICAKSVLAQMMAIIFARVEGDSLLVSFKTVSVTELLEFNDRNLNEGSSIQFVQNMINEVVFTNVVEVSQNANPLAELQDAKSATANEKADSSDAESAEKADLSSYSKIRDDGVLVFKNLCKLSMKFSSQEQPDDQILLRGKMLSLELLKVIMENGGPLWRTNERFLNVIKQFLCLSLLKNSALSVMSVFQLLCSIFQSLLSKYRSVLKSEIGIFFPMLILRVLENVLQPSFIQKMTILNLLDKISEDSQIMIDVFVNYDCDVDSPNIFERTVNGLLKTALGPPPGSTTSLSPVHDLTFRLESVKCLVIIIKSMGVWMDQQLRIGEFGVRNTSDNDSVVECNTSLGGDEGSLPDFELHQEAISDHSTATLEQRRAYKLELQKGISLFNRKPSKGIEFLISNKKIDGTPEAVALFLKNTSGLNETVIGDYLGERDDFSLKVMHAYVDSFNFDGRDFGEAIRFFLRGFRLPGEAQKIDRIMEKFAERYCKCNPNSFTSADTAYVLAYSVIMLNTDAHNSMVKDKMSKADFIRNNRGIDDGKDLPEEYLGALYDQIVKNEIKMKADTSVPQSKQTNSVNRLLGLDGILNLVWKQTEEKPLGANGALIRHIQDQFKAKAGKSESTYYAVADAAILRFMVEVCWGPMLAAFSVTLDQSDDKAATNHCLQGFRHAVHVTAVMGMQTQRDAFVTTVAKFTYLHCAADMKQKNVDAVKATIAIAIEDGNYLQDAWEHILTTLSRFEHLQLLGEGAPSDASFLSGSNIETEDKSVRSSFTSLKKKGTLQNPIVMAVVRGSSYDSTSLGVNTSGLVTPEQINSFISNLNLLEQIGNFELNHIFAHSQRLNSEAIVAFVKALCKVSMSELQSPTDPRVFSLTKIVEVAHYNMNRIRLVWSRIWNVLSDFFVSKSNSVEIRELIVRCLSQMILSRVDNVKSGWKSVFMALTAAAADERKNIVLLAFETMEKIVREYFPYITETETVTFTDCVRCLITFTNSRFNSDVSLNAIAFLRFCAVKLAEGGLICSRENADDDSSIQVKEATADGHTLMDKDENASYWIPLLSGLSSLTSDPRLAIRKSALEVLFNILKDHGHLFSHSFWITVINSVIFPVFKFVRDKKENNDQSSPASIFSHPEPSTWDSETSSVATRCLIDLFVNFFPVMRAQLTEVVSLLAGLFRNPSQGSASTGVSALMHLVGDLGCMLTEDEWSCIFLSLKETSASMLPGFLKLIRIMDRIDVPNVAQSYSYSYDDGETLSNNGTTENYEDDNLQTAGYIVSRMKTHISMQLLIMQVTTDLYNMHQDLLKASSVKIVLEIFSQTMSHAHQLSSEMGLHLKLQRACSILEISDPPVVHFENESYQNILNLLHHLLTSNPSLSDEMGIEARLFLICEEIIEIYLKCSRLEEGKPEKAVVHWILPLNSGVKEELGARTSLLVSALRVLSEVDKDCFRKYASRLFPLLVELVRCEHSSREVQPVLSNLFQTCVGPIIIKV